MNYVKKRLDAIRMLTKEHHYTMAQMYEDLIIRNRICMEAKA